MEAIYLLVGFTLGFIASVGKDYLHQLVFMHNMKKIEHEELRAYEAFDHLEEKEISEQYGKTEQDNPDEVKLERERYARPSTSYFS